jgi:hypothetical protein
MRAYIFDHVLSGGEPLKGEALVKEIVETAQSLPGYKEWCRHQHEIEHRAEEWARCIENSHYFHFGDQSKKQQPEVQDPDLTAAIDQSPSWNQRQSEATRDRIRKAIAELLEQNNLPVKPTARFQVLLKFGIGGASLYRHRDLWHPNYFGIDSNQDDATNALQSSVEIPPDPPIITDSQLDSVKNASNWHSPSSLLHTCDGDNAFSKTFSDLAASRTTANDNNSVDNLVASDLEALQGLQYVQQALFQIRAQQEAFQEAARLTHAQHQQIKSEGAQRRQIKQMQQFLESGDPILIAEAMAWAQVNPGVLKSNPLQLSLLNDCF